MADGWQGNALIAMIERLNGDASHLYPRFLVVRFNPDSGDNTYRVVSNTEFAKDITAEPPTLTATGTYTHLASLGLGDGDIDEVWVIGDQRSYVVGDADNAQNNIVNAGATTHPNLEDVGILLESVAGGGMAAARECNEGYVVPLSLVLDTDTD